MVQNLYYKSLTEYYGLSAGICALNPKITYLLEHTEGSKEERSASFSGEDVLANDWEVVL